MLRDKTTDDLPTIPPEPAWQSSKEGRYLVIMVTLDDETDDVAYSKNGEMEHKELRSFLEDLGVSKKVGVKTATVFSSVLIYNHEGKQIFARDIFRTDT